MAIGKFTFNLNDSVIFEVTPEGREMLAKEYKGHESIIPTPDPKTGLYKMQFWNFMHVFGPAMYMGNTKQPVQMNVTVRRQV